VDPFWAWVVVLAVLARLVRFFLRGE